MDSALPILLFLVFLFGSTLLVLICGMKAKEEERTSVPLAEQRALWEPQFLSELEPAVAASRSDSVDESLVERFEQFLRSEHQAAGQFVSEPSVEKLYDATSEVVPHRIPLVEHVERYLRRELSLVAQFISEPSVDRLYGRFVPQTAEA